jgi:PAS domain S-box-containing protein
LSSIADKDKDREQLLAELEQLRAELAYARMLEDTRRTEGLDSQAFFDHIHGTATDQERVPRPIHELSSTVEVFRKLLDNFPNGSINIFDKELRYIYAAGQGLEEAGLSPNQLVGKSLFELYSREDAEHAVTYFQLALEGHAVSFELPFKERLYTINAAPLEDTSGNIYAVIAVAQDSTEHKLAEERLHRMEQHAIEEYERLLERMTHLAEAFGEARDLLSIFRALRDFAVASLPCIGIFISLYDTAQDVRTACYAWGDGEEFDVSELPPMPITAEGPNSRAVRTGQVIIIDDYSKINHGVATVSIGPNEGVLPLSSLAAPMSVMGRVVGTIEVQSYERAAYKKEHVVAMRMAANLAAVAIENVRLFRHERLARATAEESNRVKDEFLATLSHELRTPLTAVLGWTKLLRERGLDEKTSARALDIIERNAMAQRQLIEEILDVSRIITGKTRLEVHPITLRPVIEAAIESVRPAVEARDIRLDFMHTDEAGLVSGDAERLQQVVWNLLSNAVKFTPEGGSIHIMLSQTGSHARIEVKDSGEGINTEFLPYVFDRFRQADGSTTRPHGGLGLGLAIVRHLVELHGGTVCAESEGPNRGSTFSINLPLLGYASEGDDAAVREGMAKGEQSTGQPNLAGLRVLALDDEPDTLEFLRVVLKRGGAQVMTASTVEDALNKIERFNPHVIISDIGMPGRDGYDFIKSLRALPPERGGSLPAIALTAYARSEDETLALRHGFQMHMPKPFEPSELITIVAALGKQVERD